MINFENWRDVARAQYDHCDIDGYWERTNIGTHIAHLHSEASELLKSYQTGPNEPCDKGIDLTAEEEECADVYLVLLNLVHKRGINLAEATRKKFEYNKTRKIKKLTDI